MSAKYPVRSLVDMARIPAEALPRFLTELPEALAVIRPLVEAMDQVDAPAEAYADLMRRMDWIDDGAGTMDVSLRLQTGEGDSVAEISAKYKMRGPA